jgi:hypothetical protein
MRLDALLDLDRELFLLVNGVQGAAWDSSSATARGSGKAAVLIVCLRTFDAAAFRRTSADGDRGGIASCANAGSRNGSGAPTPGRSNSPPRRPRPRARCRADCGARDPRPRWAARARRQADRPVSPTNVSSDRWVTFMVAALIYGFRSRRRYLFLLPAGFVGLSRVACGAHFPLDVAGGAAVGAGLSFAWLRVLEPFHGLASHPDTRTRRRLPPERAPKLMMVVGEASADVMARASSSSSGADPRTQAFGIGGEQLRGPPASTARRSSRSSASRPCSDGCSP